jgi:tetratricopeptide (TPR) repeat protein
VIQSSAATSDDRGKALNNRGVMELQDGKLDAAMADLDEAIHLNPNYGAAYYNRAHVWRAKGDSAKDAADCAQAVQSDPSLRGRC